MTPVTPLGSNIKIELIEMIFEAIKFFWHKHCFRHVKLTQAQTIPGGDLVKKAMMLLGVLLISVSCVELNGSLQVREAFNVKKKSGFLNLKTKIVTVTPGQYRAELTAKTANNLKLVLRGGSLGEINIPLKSDDQLNIPRDGQFYIEGRRIGQPFNVSGVINTEVFQYGHTSTIERCQRELRERRCEKVCNKEEGKCDIVCKDVTITIDGLKDIAYHYKRTERLAQLEFMPENSTSIAATLPVRGMEIDKIIDRESLCR